MSPDHSPDSRQAEPRGDAPPRGATGWRLWVPGLSTWAHYRREWFPHDLMAGLVLTAILVPVGMGYAEASGLPAIHGLYATMLPLVAYALFGPSRIMVLGPDSTLAAVIAALILPMAAGSPERAIALAGMLALLSGLCALLIGLARLGLAADLISKPIRIGFLNAVALTVLVGQLPRIFGFSVEGQDLPTRTLHLLQGLAQGRTQPMALAIGASCLAGILLLKFLRPQWPGILVAVLAATGVSAYFDLAHTAQLAVVGPLPPGLPFLQWPAVSLADAIHLLPGAAMIALLSFTDTSVLSRALAQRGGYAVDQNQEMLALGAANLANGLFQGFPVSSSASRTPVAEAAGARTQVTGLVGAMAIALLLLAAPDLLRNLPGAALGAVVVAACLSFADIRGMAALLRLRPVEFALSVVSFLGVAFVGVIEGIVITLLLSMLVLVWNTWHPYFAELVRVDGSKGFHDIRRHPEGRRVPGLLLFRWDAQLFFANSEVFRKEVHRAVARAPTPTVCVVVAADAITDVDVTAADALTALHAELQQLGIALWFAGMKGPVKDRLRHYGTLKILGDDIFAPTVGRAVNLYREQHPVAWKDWDETGD
ncbi:MAG: SulP family inorganic anion transporter [Rhodoferax sp.]|jgi:high affinity sulfate transporter 1|nr:SulP family inorganic anion transporter [Rhodoferax sp.]